MSLGQLAKLASFAAPIIIPGAGGAIAGLAAGTVAAGEAKKKARKEQAQFAQEREKIMMNYPSGFDPVTGSLTNVSNANKQAGFGAGFGSFLGEATRNIVQPVGSFLSGIGNIFGGGRPTSSTQQPAITTVTNVGAQESQGSGSIQAGFGSVLPSLVSGARSFVKSPLGQIAFGTSVGGALSLLDSAGKPMRVTRKMKSQLKMLLRQTNNNYALVGDFLGLNTEQMLFVLNKTFRNDGPVVTKAALRKTKSTIRKLKNMCDMYDDLRPAARRRAPMRRATRASTTLIKN